MTVPLGLPAERQERDVSPRPIDFGNLRVLILTESTSIAEDLSKQFSSWHIQHHITSSIPELSGRARYDLVIYYGQKIIDPMLSDLETYTRELEYANAEMIVIVPMEANLGVELRKNRRVSVLYHPLNPSILLDKIQELKVLKSRGIRGSSVSSLYKRKTKRSKKILKVLLVEDNIANQKVSTYQLRKLGFDVDAVANGVEAIAAFKNIPYDVILMDCLMPEMDGYQATREIRKIEAERKLSRIPIIAMTANVLEGEREKCLNAGMDDFLGKPVYIEELDHALSRYETPRGRNGENSL